MLRSYSIGSLLWIFVIVLPAFSEDVSKELAALRAQTAQLQKQLQALEAQLNKKSSPKLELLPAKQSKVNDHSTQLVDHLQMIRKKGGEQPQMNALEFKSGVDASPDALETPRGDNKNRLAYINPPKVAGNNQPRKPIVSQDPSAHDAHVTVRALDIDPESVDFYPTALVADGRVLTYIAGTPVVTSPYLGSRPAFDGSDYIVNISSINRDIRLMQQRRNLYRTYEKVGYSAPNMPILMLSGKAVPVGYIGRSYNNAGVADWTFAASEFDIAAFLNDKVEAYMGIAYNQAPPVGGGPRVANSLFGLNLGFINIGDLDSSPIYLTAGQVYAPFGRFSTGMISAPLPMIFARIRTRPLILGYKSQSDSGVFAAAYAFRSDTDLGNHAAGGLNLGYIVNAHDFTAEVGVSLISSVDDSAGLQYTGTLQNNTFAGFASPYNGSENVKKIPTGGTHLTLSFDRYNLTAEWVTNLASFPAQDLSFNGEGVMGSSGQIEGAVTFMAFNRPAGFAVGYQWTNQLLALNLPQHRFLGTFNISIWKDTVESIEYRHDIDYSAGNYANGAAPMGLSNINTYGSNGTFDMLSLQIGVYF
jgi:hypothetical protein